jgi:hypothetical protein
MYATVPTRKRSMISMTARDIVLEAFAEKSPARRSVAPAVAMRPTPIRTTPAVSTTHPMTGMTRRKRQAARKRVII